MKFCVFGGFDRYKNKKHRIYGGVFLSFLLTFLSFPEGILYNFLENQY